MLKDIKNVMASKRVHSNSSSSSSSCTLVNAVTNEKFNLPYDEKFVIGRSLECSLVIEELYISRRHSIIEYENNQFIIYDNTTCTGTIINGEKIPKGKSNFVTLKHGDLIGFGDKRKLNYIFKFCMFSNDMKKPKFDIKPEDTVPVQEKLYKKSLLKLHSEVLNLKVENLVLINKTKTELSKFQKMINTSLECAGKLNETVIKQKDIIEDLNKKIDEYRGTLMIQQDCLDNKDVLQESSIEMFKNQINNLLENDLQCPICNEVLFKAVTASCYHTFCGCCISTWLSKSKVCPVCRAEVKSIANCLAMDNFVTNLCEIVGGTVKEQRDNLVKERIPLAVSPARARRGRARRGRGSRGFLQQYQQHIINTVQFPPLPRGVLRINDDIEVVDLTNNVYTA